MMVARAIGVAILVYVAWWAIGPWLEPRGKN